MPHLLLYQQPVLLQVRLDVLPRRGLILRFTPHELTYRLRLGLLDTQPVDSYLEASMQVGSPDEAHLLLRAHVVLLAVALCLAGQHLARHLHVLLCRWRRADSSTPSAARSLRRRRWRPYDLWRAPRPLGGSHRLRPRALLSRTRHCEGRKSLSCSKFSSVSESVMRIGAAGTLCMVLGSPPGPDLPRMR